MKLISIVYAGTYNVNLKTLQLRQVKRTLKILLMNWLFEKWIR